MVAQTGNGIELATLHHFNWKRSLWIPIFGFTANSCHQLNRDGTDFSRTSPVTLSSICAVKCATPTLLNPSSLDGSVQIPGAPAGLEISVPCEVLKEHGPSNSSDKNLWKSWKNYEKLLALSIQVPRIEQRNPFQCRNWNPYMETWLLEGNPHPKVAASPHSVHTHGKNGDTQKVSCWNTRMTNVLGGGLDWCAVHHPSQHWIVTMNNKHCW